MYITKSLGNFNRAVVIISAKIGVPYLFTAGIEYVETFTDLQKVITSLLSVNTTAFIPKSLT